MMQPDELDYRAIRKNVETSLKKQKAMTRWVFLGVSLLMFGLFMIISWGMASETGLLVDGNPVGENIIGALVMLNVGWFTSILFQFITATLDTKNAENSMRAQLMSREISKAMLELGADESEAPAEKAKRMMRLSDDGELEEIIDAPAAKSGRQQMSE